MLSDYQPSNAWILEGIIWKIKINVHCSISSSSLKKETIFKSAYNMSY